MTDDAMGACVEMCSDDGDCHDEDKCCSNGCGHACQRAVFDTGTNRKGFYFSFCMTSYLWQSSLSSWDKTFQM